MPVNYDFIPRATYCQPQIGSMGYSEQQAKDKGYDVKTSKFPFAANGKAWGLGEGVGFVKVVADATYNEILGVHMIGPEVTELLAVSPSSGTSRPKRSAGRSTRTRRCRRPSMVCVRFGAVGVVSGGMCSEG